jgi:hypothetical protein
MMVPPAANRLLWRIGTAHIVRINVYVAGAYSSLSHGSRGLVRGETTFVPKRTEAKNKMRLAGRRKIVFGNGFSDAIGNPYCVESLSTKFGQGFPSLSAGCAVDKNAGPVTRIVCLDNNIHNSHLARH